MNATQTRTSSLQPETRIALRRVRALLASVYDDLAVAAINVAGEDVRDRDADIALLTHLGVEIGDLQQYVARALDRE